ncbi:SRPBCC family protein [Nocardia sp. NPDC058658]|uniref:SRPBCC family protein n=1 Tax=Nocardia sp. NPDC058658 TaxID=3346580 RepID=UPI003654151F
MRVVFAPDSRAIPTPECDFSAEVDVSLRHRCHPLFTVAALTFCVLTTSYQTVRQGDNMPAIIEHQGVIAAPKDFTFDFITDYRNVPSWMFGVSEFTPVGIQESGPGTVFAMTFTSPVAALRLRLTAVDWRPGEVFDLRSQHGPEVTARFAFAAPTTDTTLLSVRVSYPPGKGLTGRIMDKVNETIVGRALRHVETSLRREVARAYTAREH